MDTRGRLIRGLKLDYLSLFGMLSGFVDLSLADQIHLLKCCWLEILMLGLMWRSVDYPGKLIFSPDFKLNRWAGLEMFIPSVINGTMAVLWGGEGVERDIGHHCLQHISDLKFVSKWDQKRILLKFSLRSQEPTFELKITLSFVMTLKALMKLFMASVQV